MGKIPVSTDITAAKNSVWVRWLPNALPAAGYIGMKNSADKDIKVTKIVSPDYQRITIYQTAIGSENAKMVKVDGVTVPAKGDFSFVPGSYHIMFEKPTHLITPGDNARVIFHLDNGTVFTGRRPRRLRDQLRRHHAGEVTPQGLHPSGRPQGSGHDAGHRGVGPQGRGPPGRRRPGPRRRLPPAVDQLRQEEPPEGAASRHVTTAASARRMTHSRRSSNGFPLPAPAQAP